MNKPILNTEAERLLFHTFMELQEYIGGHILCNPMSLSLLCILCNVSLDEQGNIIHAFYKIAETTPFDDLNLDLFRNALVKNCKELEGTTDLVVKGFVKACAKCHVPELAPFAQTLYILEPNS